MKIDPISEFLTPDSNDVVPASTLLNSIMDDYIELVKLTNTYERNIQTPNLQKALKVVMEHKGFLLSQSMTLFYLSMLEAITEMEYKSNEQELATKLKYSHLSS
jgi:hypothetical protein